MKRSSPVPVTTGEIWTVWIDHPELASAVDFIAAHILPYWDGFAASPAVDHTIEFYDKLRQMHPGKRIVIAEFGWPSAGYNFHDANPGRIEQALVLRDFVTRAEAYGIDYNIVEAIDQPWKTMEGGVGPYWGLFDAVAAAEILLDRPDHRSRLRQARRPRRAARAAAVAADPGHGGVTLTQALLLAVSANRGRRLVRGDRRVLEGPLFCPRRRLRARSRHYAPGAAGRHCAGADRGDRRDRFWPPAAPARHSPPLVPEAYAPKVSIHVPACCEPPEMLSATLDAVARLDYPNLECVVVINNTPDPALWRPIEEHCRALGERFKFIRLENHTGYKAGALRVALENTAADADIIGVIDADYVVEPDWLRDLVPLFADPRVGLVQSPQDHRDGDRSLMHPAMNAEYAGFFDIGMVQRNEFNAIIVHGTMCLIRRAAIDSGRRLVDAPPSSRTPISG